MKTSVNTMDLRIAKAMKEAANVVFSAMPINQDVNITSMQVYEHFTNEKKRVTGMPKDNDWYANIRACSGNGYEIRNDAEIVITVDSFDCKLFGVDIFRMLHTFEKLACVKDRARFVYSVPASSSAVTLNISVDKSAKDLFMHVAKDELRPVMDSIYIDFVHSNIVASDSHTIQVTRCNIEGAQPDINGVAIPSHIAKNAFAKRSFVMTIDGDHIVCNNEAFEIRGRYPNYLSVWRSFSSEDDELIQLAPNAWKEITSKAKAMQKQYTKVMFVFHALSGEHVITIDVWNFYENVKVNEFKVNTAAAVPVSFAVGFFTDTLTRFKGVERFQGLDAGRGVVMYGANYLGILMPGNMADLPVNYPMFESENKGAFAPIAAYQVKRVINEPVERVETINEPVEPVVSVEPVEISPESRMSATAFISSFVAMMAACILSFVIFVVKPSTMPAAAAHTVASVAISEAAEAVTISEAAEAVTIEAAINEVICTGSIDPYIELVKEEITRNYRAVMESQLQELAELASVDNSEVIAALETSETNPETPESVPAVESIEDTENTPESVGIVPTETDTETDGGTVSDNTEIDYDSSEYVELSVITTDANGDPVVNVYSVPLNEQSQNLPYIGIKNKWGKSINN